MKKTTAIIFLLSSASLLTIYVGCEESKPKPTGDVLVSEKVSRLPNDVLQSCTLTQSQFNSWFASGAASENGLVVPANSVLFPHNNNCDFYQWSWQMFAWMTSPVSGNKYTAGNTVMESKVFYTVTPPQDTAGNRTLIPHQPGTPLRVSGSIPQQGPNRLPLIRDKEGNLVEIEQQATGAKPMLLMGKQKVMVSSVDMDAAGKPVFKDETGKIIENPKAVITHKADPDDIAQEIKTSSGQSVFINAQGKIIETEVGQAGGGNALMAQNGSVVYYITMVNDVFAFYLSGAKNGLLDPSKFPITAADRDNICAYARANGATLPDSNALAMEIKTSWVEASKLPDPQNYITIDAIIPTYTNSGDTLWVPNGEKTEKLALLGVHVVGSVAGHPEMIWATFEHNRNTPNDAYQYLNSDSALVTQPADSGGNWTLSANAPASNPNVHFFKASGDTLKAYSGYTISASNSSLVFTWGTQANVSPNAEDGSSAASNSEILSINNTVLNFLIGNDVRKNYMLIGATWTFGGAGPNGESYSYDPTHANGDAIGTSLLANSTMETYFQRDSTSCFFCHSNSGSLLPADLSHVYSGILPLFKTMAEANKPK